MTPRRLRSSPLVTIAAIGSTLAGCNDQSPTSETVAFKPCVNVTYLAYQPKGGRWSQVSPEDDGSYSIAATERLAILYVFTSSTTSGVLSDVYYVTRDELKSFAVRPCSSPTAKNVTGSVASVPTGNTVRVTIGTGSVIVTPSSTSNFSLFHVTSGEVDLVATAQSVVSGQTQANRILIRRAQSLGDGSSTGTLSFAAGGAAQDVTTGTATIAGFGSGETGTFTQRYYTAARTSHLLVSATGITNGARASIAVPAAMGASGDLYLHTVSHTSTGTFRSSIRFDDAAGDRTVILGPALQTPTIAAISTASGRLRTTLTAQGEYPSYVTATLAQSSGGSNLFNQRVFVTANYLGATPSTWTIDTPDYELLPNYPATAKYLLPATINWDVAAFQGSVGAFFAAAGQPTGSTFSSARRFGSMQIN